MGYQLPNLPYAFDALEPYIDAKTMEIHHDKHHAAYVANVNAALESAPELAALPIEEVLKDLNRIPEKIRQAVINNGGGHANHTFFWEIMAAQGGGDPSGDLGKAIQETFGSVESFRDQFNNAAKTRFGSGWAWLVVNPEKKLAVYSTANQDSPISLGHVPILGLDVWEHAYYLKYQNRRPDYVAAFWNVVNWKKVADLYDAAKK